MSTLSRSTQAPATLGLAAGRVGHHVPSPTPECLASRPAITVELRSIARGQRSAGIRSASIRTYRNVRLRYASSTTMAGSCSRARRGRRQFDTSPRSADGEGVPVANVIWRILCESLRDARAKIGLRFVRRTSSVNRISKLTPWLLRFGMRVDCICFQRTAKPAP